MNNVLALLLCALFAGCTAHPTEDELLYAQATCPDAVTCTVAATNLDTYYERQLRRERRAAFMNQCSVEYDQKAYWYCENDTLEKCWRRQERGSKVKCACTCVVPWGL